MQTQETSHGTDQNAGASRRADRVRQVIMLEFSCRERQRLVRERTAHINRIKGLLFGQGIRSINITRYYKTLTPADLVMGDGRPFRQRKSAV